MERKYNYLNKADLTLAKEEADRKQFERDAWHADQWKRELLKAHIEKAREMYLRINHLGLDQRLEEINTDFFNNRGKSSIKNSIDEDNNFITSRHYDLQANTPRDAEEEWETLYKKAFGNHLSGYSGGEGLNDNPTPIYTSGIYNKSYAQRLIGSKPSFDMAFFSIGISIETPNIYNEGGYIINYFDSPSDRFNSDELSLDINNLDYNNIEKYIDNNLQIICRSLRLDPPEKYFQYYENKFRNIQKRIGETR